MTLMYVGLFYMTNGQYQFIKSDTSAFHYVLFPFILLPSLWFLYCWIKTVIINFLMLIYIKNLQMFRLVTLNLYDSNKFYRTYFNPETLETHQSFEKDSGEQEAPKQVDSLDIVMSHR